LQESVPLRTVFQAFLAARNAVAQRPFAGYTLQYLLSTHNERLGSWSTERLVVELLEAAQMRRSRLRFMRKIAVGHLPLNNASRRHVWRFLDDLSASPWDALPLLLTCKGDMCDTEFIRDIRAKKDCMRGLEQRAGEVLRSIQPNSLLFVQTTELQRQAAAGVVTCQVALDTVLQSSRQLCSWFGFSEKSSDSASQCLRLLRVLGQNLDRELSSLRRSRARTRRGASALLNALWPAVDTSLVTLQVSGDLELRRQILLSPVQRDEDLSTIEARQAAAKRRKDAAIQRAKIAAEESFHRRHDLWHGGPEGSYRRDPLTGRWITDGSAR